MPDRLNEVFDRKRQRIQQLRSTATEPEYSWLDWAATTGLRVVPSIAGTLGGGALGAAAGAPAAGVGAFPAGAAGAAAGGAAGGAFGEWLAQEYEKARGLRKALSPGSIGVEAALGAIPLGKSATLAKAAAKGAGMSAAGTAAHSYVEEGELPGMGTLALSAGLGGAFGAGAEAGLARLFGRAEAPPAPASRDVDIDATGDYVPPIPPHERPVRYGPEPPPVYGPDEPTGLRVSRLGEFDDEFAEQLGEDIPAELLYDDAGWSGDMRDAWKSLARREAGRQSAENEARFNLMEQLRSAARREAGRQTAETERAAQLAAIHQDELTESLRSLRRREASVQSAQNEAADMRAATAAQGSFETREAAHALARREAAIQTAQNEANAIQAVARRQQINELKDAAKSVARRQAGRASAAWQEKDETLALMERMDELMHGPRGGPEPPPSAPVPSGGGAPEAQPRLPGDVGAVRDVEVPTATFELPPQQPPPFDLQPEAVAQSQLKTLFQVPDEAVPDTPRPAVLDHLDRQEFDEHYVNRSNFRKALEEARANPNTTPAELATLQKYADEFEEIVAEDIERGRVLHGDAWVEAQIAAGEAEIAKRAKGGRGGVSRVTPPEEPPASTLAQALGVKRRRTPLENAERAALEAEAVKRGRGKQPLPKGADEFAFGERNPDNPEGLTRDQLKAYRAQQKKAAAAEEAEREQVLAELRGENADLPMAGNHRKLLEDIAGMGGIRIHDPKGEFFGEIRRLLEFRPTMQQWYKNDNLRHGIRWGGYRTKTQADVFAGVKGVFTTRGKGGLRLDRMAENLRAAGWDIQDGNQLMDMMEAANRALSEGYRANTIAKQLGNQAGEIGGELAGALAGGTGGALVGATQGDTPMERAGFAVLGGLAGAGGSAALARFLSGRAASRAALAATGDQSAAGTAIEHRVPGPQGTVDTAPGMNRNPNPVTKVVTPTGTYTDNGPKGAINLKTKEVQRAKENEVLRFLGGDVPAAKRMPKAQREELGFDHFPEEQREGMEDLVLNVIGKGDRDRALDMLEAQRRGRQPMARSQALGQHMAVSTKDKLAPGTNLSAAGHAAYGDAVASIQDDMRVVAQRIKDTGGTDADLMELGQLQAGWRTLFLNYMGLRSEAGRALQIYNAMKRVMPHEIRLVRELLDRGRLRKDMVDFADVMTNLDADPVKAFEQLRSHETRTLGQRVVDYYMANILSGIKTQERNFLGNASRLVSRLAVKAGTGGLDALQSMLTGAPRRVYSKEVLHELQGGFAGFSKAWEDFSETLQHGFSPTAIREGLQSSEGPVYLPKTELPGGGRNPLNYPGRLLEAADRLFRNLNGSMELHGLTYSAARKQAEREGLDGSAFTNRVADLMTGMRANPSDELKHTIAKAAERAVFQEDPGAAVNTLISLKKQVPALNYVIPFVRTVSNIMKQGAEHTPLGFLMKRARQSDDLREQTIARGEAAMGTLAMLPIAYYAATGNISGSGPKDPAKRAALYEEGWRPNSVRIGDRWVSYTLAQPFSIPLSIVANGFEAWQEATQDATEKTKLQHAESIVAQTVARVGKSALDQSFLSGLGDLVKAINDPERSSSGFFARVASGFVPLSGLQRNVAQFIDPTVRQPTGLTETLLSGIPGASFMVQPRLNRFGEEAQRERQTAVLVPEATAVTDDPVAMELTRLGLDIGLPTDRINFAELAPGKRQLTDDESFGLRQTRGRATRVILDSVMQLPGYQGLPDVLKAELLRRALRDQMGDVNDVARIALQGGRPDLLQQLSAPLEELAASTYR